MNPRGIISERPPLDTAGGEALRNALVDAGAFARLLKEWDAKVSPKGGIRGRRGPAFSAKR